MSNTPSGSRASSIAAFAPSGSNLDASHGTKPAWQLASQANLFDDQPGCHHIESLSSSQLQKMLKRYALGVRWGKKVRRGIVSGADEEDEEDGVLRQNGHSNGKRRKLLPYPTCTQCQTTLPRAYLCLDCAFAGCLSSPNRRRPIIDSCIARHLAKESHGFAFELHTGHLFCQDCGSGVNDPRFDAIYQRERRRISSRSVQRSSLDEKDWATLCQLPLHPITSRVPRGIHNLGATCFLSVILQSFIHNPLLRNFFLADRHNADLCNGGNSDPCLACEMDKMFREFFGHDQAKSASANDPWTPNSFLYTIWRAQDSSELSQSGQQDSHELFISALNCLHNCLTSPGKDPSTRRAEIPRWPNENEGKGLSEEEIRRLEFSSHDEGGHHHQHDDRPPEYIHKLCDCIIHRAFAGVLQSDVRCLVCGYRSSTHDPVLDLSVDLRPASLIAQQQKEFKALLESSDGSSNIIENEGKKKKKNKEGGGDGKDGSTAAKKTKTTTNNFTSTSMSQSNNNNNGNSVVNGSGKSRFAESDPQDLVECLRRYCSSEKLPPSSYTCPQCGPVEASKQLSLCRLPSTLAIQLKRFEHTPLNGTSVKIETKVRFPMILDVKEFVTPSVLERGGGEPQGFQEEIAVGDFLYSLFTVIVHEGSLTTGHYYSYTLLQNQWYKANDTEVKPVEQEEVFGSRAYQLFYKRGKLENVVCS